jgi:hypothetical protein
MVHKGRRWRLNIKVKKGSSQREAEIASFINLQKLWYLLALSSHCPHHRHLEWLKLMWIQLQSICLTNHKLKTSFPMKYEYPNLMLLDLGPKQALVIVSICVSSRTANGVPPARWHGTSPHQNDKTNRQWTPRHLFLFTIGITFYCEMRRRMSTMGMLQISTMNDAWLRLVAQAFL